MTFNDEIQRAQRFQHKMSFMIFDLDKFKSINDTLGHQYGDYVIQKCSQIMKDNVRAVDVVARYGGEEFAIILINTNVIMSNIVAQRIVDTIANFPFNMDDVDAIKFIEQEYPETAKEFQKIQFEQWETFCRKQMDYGPSNIAMGTSLRSDDERRLSKIGLIVRINDKIQRLMNLVVKNNREAQNEPTMDAFKDLSVYGIIAQIVDNGKWGR